MVRKRFLCIFIVFVLIATCVPWSALKASAAYGGTFQFDENGKFTVMQITDTQDTQNPDSRIIKAITDAVSRYHPDLVVFTGDNVIETITTESNFQTAVNKILAPLINSNTKFAVTFGNHDHEGIGAPDATTQYNYYKTVGGSNFVDHDVPALDGVGSGVIPIYPYGKSSGTPAYQVYLMDSNHNPSSGSYDCPYTNQIDYYIQRSLTYPDVPSLWFQHVIIPDIYTKTMTTSGSGVSFTGSGTPFSSNSWYLDPAHINWARCSSTSVSDIYKEPPASSNLANYQSTAHRSSAAYGSKTLYESWVAYGNMKGAYFGHDHLNEFVMTTSDGIDLGYGESTTLYKTLGVYTYNDDNPGVSIYELDAGGSYTSKYVAESDLAVPPIVDTAAPKGTWRFYTATSANGFKYGLDNGTTDNVYIRFYSGDGASGDLLYQSADLAGTESGGNTGSITDTNVPTSNLIKSIQVIKPLGTDDWGCNRLKVFYTPEGGSEQLIWDYYPNEWECGDGGSQSMNTAWFSTTHNRFISFNGNGATGGATTPQYLIWGTKSVLKANGYSKSGCTFSGWNTTPDNTGTFYLQNSTFLMPDSNQTLYAAWTANQYSITFDANGGSGSCSYLKSYGTELTAPATVRTGYTFAGWLPSVPATVPLDGGTYTAQWSVNPYTISFICNGGSDIEAITRDFNTAVTAPPEPVKAGYTFVGWYSDPGLTAAVTWPYTIGAADVTFYAKWNVLSYLITFDANGGTGGSSCTMNCGDTLTAPVVARAGYIFSGWSPAVPPTVPDKDTVYTAQWVKTSYTVTFDINGGEGSTPPSVTGNTGTVITLPGQGDLARQGYTFLGWAITSDAGAPLTGFTIPDDNATLYAVWMPEPAVLSIRDGSTAVMDQNAHRIYGLKPGITKEDFESMYVCAGGNSELTYTSDNGGFGTGTVVKLIDLTTYETIETYTIVIFGDVNGDGNIDAADADICVDIQNWVRSWNRTTQNYLYLAGDVNGDGNIDALDADIMSEIANYRLTIDQTTGRLS